MAETTEITFGYMREFRTNKILPMLKDLKEQRTALKVFIDEGTEGPVVNGVIAGNPDIYPDGGTFAKTVNANVLRMHDQIEAMIEEFEGLDRKLEQASIRFEDTEDDAVLSAQELATLIDPKNAGAAGGGGYGGGDDDDDDE